MLKSEMQHQYWLTKKTVQRKLGSKEDECIVSSDAELDAKIELFKTINDSCLHLHRIIDNYQERICILAQEENAVGKFLKESGKGSTTSSKVMQSAGKSLSYCGQQRMYIRAPLLRLHHEVETFRGRAISDTYQTIQSMERERTEYRAVLSWMKSVSAQLDPDSGRGLEKFRKAQTHVRNSKAKFDRLTLDCLQKIDLLAAARCSMFSHALVAYQTSVLEFATKTTETFKSAITTLEKEPHYSFTILKELTQGENSIICEKQEIEGAAIKATVDSDQMLFFQDDYKDDVDVPKQICNKSISNSAAQASEQSKLIDITDESLDSLLPPTIKMLDQINNCSNPSDSLLGDDFGDFISATDTALPAYMPSQLLFNDFNNDMENIDLQSKTELSPQNDKLAPMNSKNSILDLFNRSSSSSTGNVKSVTDKMTKNANKEKFNRKDKSNWFDLFADLDPLANPDSLEKAVYGKNTDNEAA